MGFFQNTQKPVGLGGKLMVAFMNSGHSAMADWGFSHLETKPGYRALDAGCGGGANLKKLLVRCHDVTGLDYSEVSVDKSRKVNEKAIQKGTCKVVQGDVASLPFLDSSFDLVTAFETVYFWPGPEASFAQIYRVLKSNGTFFICNESDGENEADQKWERSIRGMKLYTAQELEKHLRNVGFTKILVERNPQKHWFCITAKKTTDTLREEEEQT